MSGPFKLKSGNTTSFKQMGSSPGKQSSSFGLSEKHFLERESTIPQVDAPVPPPSREKPSDKVDTAKLDDPKKSTKDVDDKKKAMLNKRLQEIMSNPTTWKKPPKVKKKKLTKGDVLQTMLVPRINPKKSRKVIKHYGEKVIKKGKSLYGKAKKYLKSEI